jgi:hypothetical protein
VGCHCRQATVRVTNPLPLEEVAEGFQRGQSVKNDLHDGQQIPQTCASHLLPDAQTPALSPRAVTASLLQMVDEAAATSARSPQLELTRIRL